MSGGTLLSDLVGPDGQFYSIAPGRSATIALSNPDSDQSLHPVHPSMAHHPELIPSHYASTCSRNDRGVDDVREALNRLEYDLEEERRNRRESDQEKPRSKTPKRSMAESKKSDATCIVVAATLGVVAIVVVLVLFLSCGKKKSEKPSIVYHVYTASAPPVQSAVPMSYVWPQTAQPFYPVQ